MFHVSWKRQDIGILKKIELAGYAPYKTVGNYFNTAVISKFYKNLKFIIENDCVLGYSDTPFRTLLLRKKYNLIETIINISGNRNDSHDLFDKVLFSCSKEEDTRIIQKILDIESYMINSLNRILIQLILDNSIFVFLYVINYLLEKKIQLPDVDHRIVYIGAVKKFNKVFYLALEFGLFYKSLYENRDNENDASRDFGFYSNYFGFSFCPLEEHYITYCIDKKISSISDSNYIILKRLLDFSKIELFYKLFHTYRSDIPDIVKKSIINIIYEGRKTSFSSNYIQLIDHVFKNSSLNYSNSGDYFTTFMNTCSNSTHLMEEYEYNTYVLRFIERDNLPVIKLLVEHKIDINTDNGHVLRRAIYRNYTDIIRYLLSLPCIRVNKTHFTKKQYSYLQQNNKLDEYIISLFKKYNPKILHVSSIGSNVHLLLACSQKNNKSINSALHRGADILSLGSVSYVFNHPIYKNNDLILEEYSKKYFAIKRIKRILFGRRGIIHDIRYKLGRRRIFQEFTELERVINN